MCRIDDYARLKLDEEHWNYVKTELDLWHRTYLPKDGIHDKTVLDVGAGNGETCLFYLLHGASHVICIEPESRLLRENFGDNPKVTIVTQRVEFIKSDCEGGEKNMLVETHFIPNMKYLGLVGRGEGGPAILYRIEPMDKTSIINGWIHMQRIGIAHKLKMFLKGI